MRPAAAINAWSSILGKATIESALAGKKWVFLVAAEDGRRYILKVVRPDARDASIADEYRILLHLQKAGLPVAPLLITDSGTVSADLDGDSFVLMEFLPNDRHLSPEAGQDALHTCNRIGCAIGSLASALERYPWAVESFTHDIVHQTFEIRYPALPTELRNALGRRVHDATNALSDIPMQLIHGDCNPGNVLLRKTGSGIEVSGFVDLDHLPTGQRIYDLAYYIAYRCRHYAASHSSTGHSAERFAELIAAYVSGYNSSNPLTSRELNAILPAILSAEITSTAWSYLVLTEWHDVDKDGQQDGYDQGRQSLYWILENYALIENELHKASVC